MKIKSWVVAADDEGIRPAGPADACFYCQANVGHEHKAECVIRERTVIIELTMHVLVKVPESWDKDAVELKYNESSSCISGLLEDITRIDNRMRNAGYCLCGARAVAFVREATGDDEDYYQTFAALRDAAK